MEFILASNNQKKLAEMQRILSPLGIEVKTAAMLGLELPDVVEVLPGLMPKILKQICKTSKVPVIAGGLISDKEDVMGALGAGAAAVSTTNQKVWEL